MLHLASADRNAQNIRHKMYATDNINVFFGFTRHTGLPDIFCFETTDLYDAKNLPKVIYCIHALSHLLARQGLADRIGDHLNKIEFTDEELERKQRGLDAAGVSMPSFGNIGRQLAKEIQEEREETEEEGKSDGSLSGYSVLIYSCSSRTSSPGTGASRGTASS